MKLLPLAVLLALAPVARADQDLEQKGERRDGCPAGIRSGHKSTEPADLGSMPELDSALAPSGATLALQGSYFTPREGVHRSRLLTTIAALHLNGRLPWRPWGRAYLHEVGTVLLATTHRWHETSPDVEDVTAIGNIVIAKGIRANWLSSFNRTDDQEIAGTRNAVSLQFYLGVPVRDDRALYQDLAFRSLFDDHWFRPQLPFGASIEARTELVGCYAPFIHLRIDGRREDTGDPTPLIQYVVPVTIAAGLSVSDDSSLFLQYGFIHYSSQGIYNINAYQRFRVGLDTHWGTFHATATLDAFIGSYDGMFVGLWLTQDIGGDGFR